MLQIGTNMGTYAEYIQKSNELFGYINGQYTVKPLQETVAAFRKEFESLLNEVAFSGEYPIGTSKDSCNDPISEGYQFRMEVSSLHRSEQHRVKKYFDGLNVRLVDTKDKNGVEAYIGNLAAVKSDCRIVIITKSVKSIRAIGLINELFYKTPPVLVMTIDSSGKLVFINNDTKIKESTVGRYQDPTSAHKSNDAFDLPVTGWDNLDF